MTVRKIKTAGNQILKKRAEPISEISDRVRKLAEDMAETMRTAHGLGFAAPQIGEAIRLVVVDAGYLEYDRLCEAGQKPENGPDFRVEVLVNPEILSRDGEQEGEEGCLSVPGYRAVVVRAEKIRYRYQTLDGITVEREADGLEAVCIQHETDHLDGILFIDRISRLKRNLALGKVKKFVEGLDPEEDETDYRLYGQP